MGARPRVCSAASRVTGVAEEEGTSAIGLVVVAGARDEARDRNPERPTRDGEREVLGETEVEVVVEGRSMGALGAPKP
jgi:hypothetical protein